ncbi:nuclear transport factor 2 family protein [Nocardioides sp.]|uniref:nuclear transport factor 2 family protein n=1 Tax=Nocardioides sp. TaxID=35761 RepID=UPI003D0A8127
MISAQDRSEIIELIARYNWAIDTRDAGAYAGTFLPDGVFDGGTEILTGHGELAAYVNDVIAPSPHAAGLQHWTTNHVLEKITDDECDVRSYMIGPRDGGEDGVAVRVVGWYRDRVVRSGHGWRFARRTWREWNEEDDAS